MIRPTLAVVLYFFVFSVAPVSAAAQNLPGPIVQILKQAGIPESSTAIYVHEIGAAQPVITINANTAMNPASAMKLVTTFAGLELLGPAYTWKTELYANGIVEGDTLRGDLVIKGYGDPRLNLENFWLLTRRLRQTGLREITGDLILDSSYFDAPGGDPGAFDGKPHRAYNVPPEALLVNHRILALRLIPQPGSKTVRVVVDPIPESLDLNNNLKLSSSKCNDWRDLFSTDIKDNGRVTITLNGNYPTDCGEKTLYLSLHDSPLYTFSLFKQLWMQQGGVLRGKVRSDSVSERTALLETHHSPPLAEIVRDINKFSNNVTARQLYLALGVANGEGPATLSKSNTAIRQWLTSRQLDFPELVIENGSGLSRNERISAGHLGELLLTAFQSPIMPEFVSSLPIAAVDGTMKKRSNGTSVAGQAHMKTGLLDNVKSMAGYVLDKSGRRVVVVFFVNHSSSASAQLAMDALLHWVYIRPSHK